MENKGEITDLEVKVGFGLGHKWFQIFLEHEDRSNKVKVKYDAQGWNWAGNKC